MVRRLVAFFPWKMLDDTGKEKSNNELFDDFFALISSKKIG
jgi:hypothetical protein